MSDNDTINGDVMVQGNNITVEEQIKKFQEHLQNSIEQRVAEDRELFRNSSFDLHFRSLEERSSLYYVSLNHKNETFYISPAYEDFITGRLQDLPGTIEQETIDFFKSDN